MLLEKMNIRLAEYCSRYVNSFCKTSILFAKHLKVPNNSGLRYAPRLTEDIVEISHSIDNSSQKAIKILKDGTRKVTESLKWTTKEGEQLEYTLEREYLDNKIIYRVIDTDEQVVGTWLGFIKEDKGNKILYGDSLYTKLVPKKNTRGLGTELKKIILKEAIESNCKSINIDASLNAHSFHNKMGYKCDITKELMTYVLEELKSIKEKNLFPIFNERIDSLLNKQFLRTKNKKLLQLNNLIDDMLSEANRQGLRSDEIGISHIRIPMKYELY